VPVAGLSSALTALASSAEHNGRVGNDTVRDSAWWSRSRGLPRPVHESWRSSLAAQPDRSARILAWASTSTGYGIASPTTLSYGDEEGWKHIGWHEIERGSWNAELGKLSWVLHAAPGKPSPRGSLELVKPGRLPELFRERIAATIAIERFVPLLGERGVTISARRDLGAGGTVAWHSTLTRGLSWETDGVRAAVDQAMEQLRTEYDVG
jgi:hypothetical protein